MRTATPLPRKIREKVYRRQNGSPRLTPRQRRRVRHKENRALQDKS